MNLTEETMQRLEFLFAAESRDEVASLLDRECSNNLPFLESATPADLQRFHFAALKLSRGNLDRLRDAVELAKQDWRDLLVSAGFANSSDAHLHWQPRKHDKHHKGRNAS
jgi:hypothetical protein